ncbi:MAG: hypothetical protein ACI33S_00425 [Bacilli bacterium]
MNGSFNKILIIKNKVFKIEKVVDSYSYNILANTDSDHKKYYEDLKKIEIDVAKLYFDKKIFGKNVEVQEYIKGINLSHYMENKNISVEEKINMLKKLLIIYKKTINEDVSLDLNMKNFIISENKLIYIDLVPAIYKSLLPKDDIEKDEYINYYLNINLAIANIINYFLRSIIYLPKYKLKEILKKVKIMIKELLDVNLDMSKNKKANLINEYINSNMSYQEYEDIYQNIKRR